MAMFSSSLAILPGWATSHWFLIADVDRGPLHQTYVYEDTTTPSSRWCSSSSIRSIRGRGP